MILRPYGITSRRAELTPGAHLKAYPVKVTIKICKTRMLDKIGK